MQNGVAQWFENFPIRKMMDVEGGNPAAGTHVQQFNGVTYGKDNPSQQWTPTLQTASSTYTLVSAVAGDPNVLTNSSGFTTMEAPDTESWSQQWFSIDLSGTSVLVCADGTGCLTANSNGQDWVQLQVEPYTGLATQFWGCTLVSSGRYPAPVTLLPTAALQTWLGQDTNVPRISGNGTYQVGDMICEIYRRGQVCLAANQITPATLAMVNQYIDFWLTDYDGEYQSTQATTTVTNAAVKASTAVSQQDWEEVEGDLNDSDFIPPRDPA